MDINESMLDVYLFEANSLLEQLDEILLACEKQNVFDQDGINEIFRIMHTIKGSSAMMEFAGLTAVAHKMEDLFAYVRENGLKNVFNEELFDLMFQSGDFLKAEIDAVQKNQPLSDTIGPIVSNISRLLNKISTPQDAADSPAPVEQAAQASTEQIAGDGQFVKIVFDEDAQMENLRAFMLVNALTDTGLSVRYHPRDLQDGGAGADEISQNGFFLWFTDGGSLEKGLKIIDNFVYIKRYEILEDESAGKPERQAAASATDAQREESTLPAGPAAAQPAVKAQPAASLINVNLTKLDSLMDLMGEIVVTESMVISIPTSQGVDIESFTKASRQLRKLTDELQEIVMSIRLVPVNGVFQKMNRIIRDMNHSLGKNVDLVLEGEDTEVDKTIVDNIADPLMHLVRNAMDHGIEPEEERLAKGKPARGRITLSARNTGGEILVCVRDDGHGFDQAAILKKARQRGLLKKAEKEYTAKEIFSFLMMPGFSTNETVTEYSGRGVGMDVVKKNVEKIGGDVTLESEKDKGSTIVFKIPLTLAIVNGMEISVGDSLLTIPINNIRQSFKVENTSVIHDTEGNEIVIIRDQYYPLVRLHAIFDIEGALTELSEGIVILVEYDGKSYCIFADKLLGEQQVVIKPIPLYLNKYQLKEYGISGCAILGNGSISLILDVPGLAGSLAAAETSDKRTGRAS